MARLITVSDEIYDNLSRIKGKHSFSEVIRSLLTKKGGDIMRFAGILRSTEVSAWKKEITEGRKKNTGRKIKVL
ncbi:MAG: antitoxin VapB family protein [Candidatus Micrarchaeales archaeon]|jgi:predicted CopG family antitoxin